MKNDDMETVRKTIRFDKYTLNFISDAAKENNVSFSKALKLIIFYLMIKLNHGGNDSTDLPLTPNGLSDSDKKLLSKILVLYSRSSSNLNQATRALNEMKNLSWLDMNHGEMMGKLNRIHYDLDKVSNNFDRYQDVLNKLIDEYNLK